MTTAVQYESSTHMAVVGDKKFTVRSLIPVFADEERRNADKRKLEYALYNIFRKYTNI